MTLVLTIPVIGAANPVDPIWLPGLYDDADTDHLVAQTMSPEAVIGLAVLVMACRRSSSTLAGPRAHGRGTVAGGELAARGPPRRAVMSLSAVLRSLPCRALASLS